MKTRGELLEQLLTSFSGYYTVKREGAVPPFVAEAEFHSHTEQYFLVKIAHIADIDSNEYVFFANEGSLSLERLLELDESAWKEGLSRVKAGEGHRNSDISLVILCDQAEKNALKRTKGLYRYKSYRFGLHGWSGYRVMVWEAASGKAVCNRLGKNLKALIGTAS